MIHDPELKQIYARLRIRLERRRGLRESLEWFALLRALTELEIADSYTPAAREAEERAEALEFPGADSRYEPLPE